MDYARAYHSVYSGEAALAVIHQCVHKRAALIAGGRVNDHASRLVDDQKVAVFINNVERYVFRLRRKRNSSERSASVNKPRWQSRPLVRLASVEALFLSGVVIALIEEEGATGAVGREGCTMKEIVEAVTGEGKRWGGGDCG